MKILLTGGGTGGHIIPLLSIVAELRKSEKGIQNLEFMFIGPDSDFNKSISNAEILIKKIKAGKFRRYFSLKNLIDIFKIPIGTVQSLYYIYKFKPDVVFSKGGFASVPPIIAAWILRIPIITHESDIIPGLANKIIAHFASRILISFSSAKRYFDKNKVILTGNPIRLDITKGSRKNALKFFGFFSNLPTILIFGGSQGAQKINEIVLKSLPDILEKYQVIHVCGNRNFEYLKNRVKDLELKYPARYRFYPFLTYELKDAYALCDIVVSRAGANSLSEIIALCKPNIIIPLPTAANDHQMENAKFFAEKGMVALVKEEDLTVDILTKELSKMLQESDFRANMIEKINEYNFNRRSATKLIAKEIINYIKKP